jgi:lysophospholipase L1-like esterase
MTLNPASNPVSTPAPSYDFSRILPAMGGGLLVSAGLALAAWGAFSSKSAPWNPLMVYGLIIATAGLATALLSMTGWKRTALTLLALASLDLTFGLGTQALALAGYRNSFLPMKTVSLLNGKRFTYHPLLQGVPTPGFDNGFFIHDKKGHRAILPAGNPDGPRIALIGGSSTYDLGNPAGKTWPDDLQRIIPQANLINFGVPGYSTSEHIIQTAYYLAPENVTCAVYYIGWNDIRNSFVPTLDPAYADYHLLGHVDFMRIRSVTGVSSIYNFLANARMVRKFTSYAPSPADYRGWKPRSGIDKRLEKIYRRNLHTLKAINDEQGRRTVFIPQIMNYARLTGEGRYGWFPLVRDRDIPAINDHFNAVLKQEAARMGIPFVEISPSQFNKDDFVDVGHFNARGAEKFARLIAPAIRKACGVK